MTSSHKIVIINEASLEVLNLKANKLTSPPAYPEDNPYLEDGSPFNTFGLNTNIRLAIINAGQSLDNDVETGFGMYNQGDYPSFGPYAYYVPADGATHGVDFPTRPWQFGTVHTHPENSIHDDWIPMFSLDDMYSILDIRNVYTANEFLNEQNTAGDALFTSVLIVKQNDVIQTYALKIDDITKFQKLQDVIDDQGDANGDGIDEYFKLNEKLRNNYISDANNVDGTATQYQTVLLNFIADNDLGASLYQMEQTGLGTPNVQESWKKLSLGRLGVIESNPCNN